ncbi:pyruvate ferredoxin/flavodoxin oxidoreductase, beta subunit [Methanoregula boonei 6A8]|uniref:Pyruvate ferredoxin/flavodoxin oxidoreductase, beta subunit n=1 Tax=Methanoregula boonei (strain DSM 21154 / JCM 14090 / 6A8) TaxID=456442 RepID=A7IA43_METB6|nr:thiamine pyrophosphate-dependent enzyme [Methanoregula boonei]ABS56604.1 pyruvate ferredoxin/flavodoxin oxidoreductase, beta subunit [Methanoregula boonei 6A8]
MTRNLITPVQNTWCPGCGNFSIQHTLKDILTDMEKEGRSLDDVVLVSGIGCHAKIADYLNINTVYTLHGRTIPVATGLKLANPDLTVICCAGDGDAYAEGLDHLIFAAKRNIDLTMIVHNNRVYGLTTGQYTPTSPLGFKGKSTPSGTAEYPFNPLELMFASGATYIARGYTRKMSQLGQLIRQGIAHKGFAFIDVLQICASFFNMTEYYQSHVYDLAGHDTRDFGKACTRAREWDYNLDAPIALGTFYEQVLPTFDERLPVWHHILQDERMNRVRDLFEAAK